MLAEVAVIPSPGRRPVRGSQRPEALGSRTRAVLALWGIAGAAKVLWDAPARSSCGSERFYLSKTSRPRTFDSSPW
jgi:hypothetical protein